MSLSQVCGENDKFVGEGGGGAEEGIVSAVRIGLEVNLSRGQIRGEDKGAGTSYWRGGGGRDKVETQQRKGWQQL